MRLVGKTREAVKSTWKRMGVKYMPQWARLPYFDWAEDMLLDYMHICKNNGHRVRQMLADTNVDMGWLKRLVRKWSPVPGMRAVSCLSFCKPRFSLLETLFVRSGHSDYSISFSGYQRLPAVTAACISLPCAGALDISDGDQEGRERVLASCPIAPSLGDGDEASLLELEDEPRSCSRLEGAHQPRVPWERSLDGLCRLAPPRRVGLKLAHREVLQTPTRVPPRHHPVAIARGGALSDVVVLSIMDQ